MRVRIYIEGGGSDTSSRPLRESFRKFFSEVIPGAQRLNLILCGHRDDTFRDFVLGLRRFPDDFLILLVDSERPVATDAGPWAHLKEPPDGWEKPAEAADNSAHLMVQCMEAWFLADKDALASYYGQGFRRSSLPRHADVEQVGKRQLFRALEQATQNTRKGRYHKTKHAFAILERLDPDKVRRASRRAEALCALLEELASS